MDECLEMFLEVAVFDSGVRHCDDRIDDYRQVERRWALPRGGSSVPACIPPNVEHQVAEAVQDISVAIESVGTVDVPDSSNPARDSIEILQFLLQDAMIERAVRRAA